MKASCSSITGAKLAYAAIAIVLVLASSISARAIRVAAAVGPAAAPIPPSNLTLTRAETGFVLSWTDNSGGSATEFSVARSPEGCASWTGLETVAVPTTTYTDPNPSGSSSYCYQVLARNGDGDSDWSNTATTLIRVYLPLVLRKYGTTARPAPKSVDVTVSLYNNPTGDARTPYENIIQYFADGVYEMSNGAHRIRRVTIFTGGQNADQSHIVWTETGWPNAHIGGYGKEKNGLRVSAMDYATSKASGQQEPYLVNDADWQNAGYTNAHEWGHYYYGLYDEYVGGSPTGQWLGSPLSTDTAIQNSIMHQQRNAILGATSWGREFTGDLNWLNFSTPLNNADLNNAQGRVYGASAWATLARPASDDPRDGGRASTPERPSYPEMAAFAPAADQAPAIEMPGARAEARKELDIVWMSGAGGAMLQAADTDGPALAASTGVIRQVVIESSAGMGTAKLNDIKAAVKQMVEEAEIGDTIGIVHFANTVTVAAPLTPITSEATKDTLKATLEGITAGGARAALGEAAKIALDGLTAAGVPTDAVRAVYLIADGPSTSGRNPLAVIPAYQAAFVSLYTFGYGTAGNVTNDLQQMAEDTDGQFYYLGGSEPNAALNDLLGALQDADQDTSPIVDVTLVEGSLEVGTTPATIPFYVDSTLGQFEITAVYSGMLAAASIELRDPTGAIRATNSAENCFEEGDAVFTDTICQFRVPAAQVGAWAIHASAPETELVVDYQVTASAKPLTFTFDAEVYAEDGEEIRYSATNTTTTILALISDGQYYVTGITPTLQIEFPDGVTTVLVLRDDGLAPDRRANDGVYAATLALGQNGDHTLTVRFNNHAGTARYTEFGVQLGSDRDGVVPSPKIPWPVETNFERTATTDIWVEGAPLQNN